MSADIFWSADVEMHQGNRPNQEDYARCQDECCLMVLADGMGGHSDGDKASRIVVERFSECFRHHLKSIKARGWDEDYVKGILEESVECASRALCEAKQERGNPVGSDAGCTLLAACINPSSYKVQFLSIGDSIILVKHRDRQWIWENENYLDTHLRVLRLDAKNLRDRFGVDSKEYRQARERIRTDPKRHGLTQAVTGNRHFVPHIWTSELPFYEGDRFILASDGILPLLGCKDEKLNYEKLDAILRREKYLVPCVRLSQSDRCRVTQRSAARIVKAVIAEGDPDQDNISVLLVDFPSLNGTKHLSPVPQGSAGDVPMDDNVEPQPDRSLSRLPLGLLVIALFLVSLGALSGISAFVILAQPPARSQEVRTAHTPSTTHVQSSGDVSAQASTQPPAQSTAHTPSAAPEQSSEDAAAQARGTTLTHPRGLEFENEGMSIAPSTKDVVGNSSPKLTIYQEEDEKLFDRNYRVDSSECRKGDVEQSQVRDTHQEGKQTEVQSKKESPPKKVELEKEESSPSTDSAPAETAEVNSNCGNNEKSAKKKSKYTKSKIDAHLSESASKDSTKFRSVDKDIKTLVRKYREQSISTEVLKQEIVEIQHKLQHPEKFQLTASSEARKDLDEITSGVFEKGKQKTDIQLPKTRESKPREGIQNVKKTMIPGKNQKDNAQGAVRRHKRHNEKKNTSSYSCNRKITTKT